jgi:acyl carrier protein
MSTAGSPGSAAGRIGAILTRMGRTVPAPDADLIATGVLDSLGLVELIFELEQAFGIRIELETVELDNFRSIDRMTVYIRQCQAVE